MRFSTPALLAALILTAPAAQAFTPERAAIFTGAIRAHDCAMHADDADAALTPLGLDPVEVQAFVDTLYGAGLVGLSEDLATLTLSRVLCEAEGEAELAMLVEAFAAPAPGIERWRPEFDPARGAELVALVRAEDCLLTDERAQEILPESSFTPIEVRDIVAVLDDGGLAEVAEDGSQLQLTEAFCAGDGSGDAAELAALLASWDERHPVTEDQPEAEIETAPDSDTETEAEGDQ